MKQTVANYTVIIEEQVRTGSKKSCYYAYVPILGIATEADTLMEIKKEIKKLVEFHIESLAEEGEEIPVEQKPSIITMLRTILPKNAQIAAN